MSDVLLKSSIQKLQQDIDNFLTDRATPILRDDANELSALQKELKELTEGLNLNFYITLLDIEKDLFALVISEYSIVGADRDRVKDDVREILEEETRKKNIVEFKEHFWKQRTYMYWSARRTHKATWGVFTHLADYWYIMGVSQDYQISGIAKGKKKMAPILFLRCSDGQCEAQDYNIRHMSDRETPVLDDVTQVRNTYVANVAEKAMHRVEVLTQDVEQMRDNLQYIDKYSESYSKKQAEKFIREWFKIQEVQKEGIGNQIIHLLTQTSMKYIFYALLAILAYLGFALIMNVAFGVAMPLPFELGTGAIPDTGIKPVEPP